VNLTRFPKEDHLPTEQVAATKKGWSRITGNIYHKPPTEFSLNKPQIMSHCLKIRIFHQLLSHWTYKISSGIGIDIRSCTDWWTETTSTYDILFKLYVTPNKVDWNVLTQTFLASTNTMYQKHRKNTPKYPHLNFQCKLEGCIHIQGVPGGMCQTSGGCSLC
jgi:hypothetical protein